MQRLLEARWKANMSKATAATVLLGFTLTLSPVVAHSAQDPKQQDPKQQDPKQQDVKQPDPKQQDPKQEDKRDARHKNEVKAGANTEKVVDRLFKLKGVTLSPAELVVETAILAYGGRGPLQTARSSIEEQGTIRLATDQGDINGKYRMRSIRKDKSWQDLLRTDLELSVPEAAQKSGAPATIKYVIAYNGASVWAAQNNQYVSPRTEAEAAFRAQLVHDYTALLRYKEDGSKIDLVGPENVVGIDTKVIDLTTPDGQKTRFWVSAKTYRILHLEYEMKVGESPTPGKFHVSFYAPFRVVQNILVPSRRLMEQNGKFVQEITISTFSYSTKIEPQVFQHLQEG